MIRLSRTTKMDGILSWSLPAGSTCPGSYQSDGIMVDACKGCYAKQGRYPAPNVREPREHNRRDWRRDEWVDEMVWALNDRRWFRWFDSGDVYHPDLAAKILEVMKKAWWISHWLPTRCHKLERTRGILEEMNSLPNVCVRYSSDSIDGDYDEIHGSTIIPTPETDDDSLKVCPVYPGNQKTCDRCRACWDKEVKRVAYVAHGAKVKKLIRLKQVA